MPKIGLQEQQQIGGTVAARISPNLKNVKFLELFGHYNDDDYAIEKQSCSWLQICTGNMLYKFQVDNTNTLLSWQDRKFSLRKECLSKDDWHNDTDEVIDLKKGTSEWELPSNIVLTAKIDVINGLLRHC